MAKEKETKSAGGKKSMDINSIAGWLLIIVCLVSGIILTTNHLGSDEEGGPAVITAFEALPVDMALNFFDPPSIFIVLGGTIAGLMLSYPLSSFAQVPKHMKIVFMPTKYDSMDTIDQIVELAKEARINGLLALEDKLSNAQNAFLRDSLMMVVDSVEPEKVKQHLETELDYLDERHAQARAFYNTGAALGPAFGMIGTLIGLIKLMSQLDNPEMLAAGMSVALVTTMYGSILANVFFAPLAAKLKARHDEEYLCKTLIAEGVQAIQAGDNPKFIEEKLVQLIPSIEVEKGNKKKGKKGGEAPSGESAA